MCLLLLLDTSMHAQTLLKVSSTGSSGTTTNLHGSVRGGINLAKGNPRLTVGVCLKGYCTIRAHYDREPNLEMKVSFSFQIIDEFCSRDVTCPPKVPLGW